MAMIGRFDQTFLTADIMDPSHSIPAPQAPNAYITDSALFLIVSQEGSTAVHRCWATLEPYRARPMTGGSDHRNR